jgi:molecular chaperone IbpA
MTLDLPQFTRSTVGFDRLFNEIERSFANSQSNNYPPYNVAVAGFGMDNLDITVEKNQLTVEGTTIKGGEEVKYLHKGIGNRNFRRSFTLAEHVEVANANLEYGMLNMHLVRNVPEELQPKRIMITAPNVIEG